MIDYIDRCTYILYIGTWNSYADDVHRHTCTQTSLVEPDPMYYMKEGSGQLTV